MTDTKIQRFKFAIPIIKTRVKIVKDKEGNEVEERYVEGIASGTELDKHGDRMAPSAIESMAKSLKQHVINLNDEHDTSWSGELGDITKLTISKNDDLEIVAKLNEMSSAGDLWYALTGQNKKLGLSIGGYVKDYEMVKEGEGDDVKWVRLYKKIELDHIAVTSRPAYPKAWVSVISKSIDGETDNELILKKEMEEIQKPYPNEHACRLKDPAQYDTCRRGTRSHNGKGYSVVYCKKTGGKMEEQSYRYNKKTWSASEARSHCKAHGGSFEAAKPQKKSIEEENKEKSKRSQKEKQLRELARSIARSIQNLESDLLLELIYKGLWFLDEEQILVLERSLSVAKKKNSLEAENVKKDKAEDVEPDDEEADDSAAPEDEESEEEESEEEVEEEKSKAKSEDEESEEDSGDEEESEEEGEEEVEESEDDEEEESESEEEEEEESEEESEEKSTVKVKVEEPELKKIAEEVSSGMKKVLKGFESLEKRIKELETQPAGRKTVEIQKGLGDEEGEARDAEELIEERDKKIEEVKKKHTNDPNLFARIQRIRAEYSQKVQL